MPSIETVEMYTAQSRVPGSRYPLRDWWWDREFYRGLANVFALALSLLPKEGE